VISRIRRGASVGVELEAVLGSELTERFLATVKRAAVAKTAAPREAWETSKRTGVRFAPRRSARARFLPMDVRTGEDNCTRRMAVFLLCVLEHLWHAPAHPDKPRVCNWRVYLPRLAARVGVTPRELERYLAIFRSAGLVDAWQPPKTDKTPRHMHGTSGHCYNVYRLNQPIPRALAERLKKFQTRLRADERAELTSGKAASSSSSSDNRAASSGYTAEAFYEAHPHLRPPPI